MVFIKQFAPGMFMLGFFVRGRHPVGRGSILDRPGDDSKGMNGQQEGAGKGLKFAGKWIRGYDYTSRPPKSRPRARQGAKSAIVIPGVDLAIGEFAKIVHFFGSDTFLTMRAGSAARRPAIFCRA